MTDPVPFNRPGLLGGELAVVERVMTAGAHASGTDVRACERVIEEVLGAPRVVITTSGTHALEMAALLLDVREGDEVIVPSFTFASTAAAFALRGARVAFADVRRDTLCLDVEQVASLIGPRTRAVVPVHYAGVGVDMAALADVMRDHAQVAVVEDHAHGPFSRRGGRWLGTYGALAALSFHETKNLTCGEGGALVINDPSFEARAEIVRDKGTDRARFLRGDVDRYTWRDLGSSYVLADVLAAVLFSQLSQREEILRRRRSIFRRYATELAAWAQAAGMRLPFVPADCDEPMHLFYLLAETPDRRDAFMAHLRARGVASAFHYQPLHLSPMGREVAARPSACPVTEWAADRLVRLPFFTTMTSAQQDRVIEVASSFT